MRWSARAIGEGVVGDVKGVEKNGVVGTTEGCVLLGDGVAAGCKLGNSNSGSDNCPGSMVGRLSCIPCSVCENFRTHHTDIKTV